MRARNESTASAFARAEVRRLAKRIRQLDDNRDAIGRIVTDSHPELLALTGVGPVVAAQVLNAWSHDGRVSSDTAFASLAGTCPIPASSGKNVRCRLNRGGDRQLNRAISAIVIVRMGGDERTRAYVALRTAEGRGSKEIQWFLKRYVTRKLFRALHFTAPPLRGPADRYRSICRIYDRYLGSSDLLVGLPCGFVSWTMSEAHGCATVSVLDDRYASGCAVKSH